MKTVTIRLKVNSAMTISLELPEECDVKEFYKIIDEPRKMLGQQKQENQVTTVPATEIGKQIMRDKFEEWTPEMIGRFMQEYESFKSSKKRFKALGPRWGYTRYKSMYQSYIRFKEMPLPAITEKQQEEIEDPIKRNIINLYKNDVSIEDIAFRYALTQKEVEDIINEFKQPAKPKVVKTVKKRKKRIMMSREELIKIMKQCLKEANKDEIKAKKIFVKKTGCHVSTAQDYINIVVRGYDRHAKKK